MVFGQTVEVGGVLGAPLGLGLDLLRQKVLGDDADDVRGVVFLGLDPAGDLIDPDGRGLPFGKRVNEGACSFDRFGVFQQPGDAGPIVIDATGDLAVGLGLLRGVDAQEKRCGEEEMKVIAKDGMLVESSKLLDPNYCVGEWTGIARFSHKFSLTLMTRIGVLLEAGHLQEYDTFALTQLAQQGESIHIIGFTDQPWMEIDTAEDLQAARELFGDSSP